MTQPAKLVKNGIFYAGRTHKKCQIQILDFAAKKTGRFHSSSPGQGFINCPLVVWPKRRLKSWGGGNKWGGLEGDLLSTWGGGTQFRFFPPAIYSCPFYPLLPQWKTLSNLHIRNQRQESILMGVESHKMCTATHFGVVHIAAEPQTRVQSRSLCRWDAGHGRVLKRPIGLNCSDGTWNGWPLLSQRRKNSFSSYHHNCKKMCYTATRTGGMGVRHKTCIFFRQLTRKPLRKVSLSIEWFLDKEGYAYGEQP